MVRGIIVTGPTASGKTRLAVSLARKFDGEVVSADSRQVYRGLDIGTGKDLGEYGEGDRKIPVHLIDVAGPMEEYNLARFLDDAWKAVAEIAERGRVPIVCGGSPLYVHALVAGYDLPDVEPDHRLRAEMEKLDLEKLVEVLERERPDFAAGFGDKANKRRVIRAIEAGRFGGSAAEGRRNPRGDVAWLCLATQVRREDLWKRIEARLDERLNAGMIEEVEALRESGVSWERLDSLGLEYRFVSMFLKGDIPKREMREKLFIAIRRFAKRQETWFRKMEREGMVLRRVAPDDFDKAERLAENFLTP